ncbi:MAG: FAD-dependent thymidylate synthase [Microthrixaceae bacterium]
MFTYQAEEFTDDETSVLRRYFTNLDRPVFALTNLPEVVKGALFARYSRSAKSLRRLFLDEFVVDLDISADAEADAGVGLDRAEKLYEKVFVEYGDDSVAQLGGVHLACEQASNILTKLLEWGRLASYLEQSTRYIPYDARMNGRFRYYRDPEVLGSRLGARYVGDMDDLFDTYSALLPVLGDHFRRIHPKHADDSDFVYRQSIRAKSFDALRGLLPAAAQSNVGIYGSGQAYEALLLRLRAHPLPEARAYADDMLNELRKVIPSFLRRVDVPDRGGAWSNYLATNRSAMSEVAERLFEGRVDAEDEAAVRLVDWDPEAETKMIAAMLEPHTHLSDATLLAEVASMSAEDRRSVVAAYVGQRSNRRHKPGRGLERVNYRFEVVADYGAFRDLQRHRMMTIEWQDLTPYHGYLRPAEVDDAGAGAEYDRAMATSAGLHDVLARQFPDRASYAVALGYRVRFVMNLNAREAMHLTELRSAPQGHASYRVVAQQMHRAIADVAGHRLVADMMSYVDHGSGVELERLEAERRAEARRDATTA